MQRTNLKQQSKQRGINIMGKYLDDLRLEEKKKKDEELKELLLKELRNEKSNVVIIGRLRKAGLLLRIK